MWRRCGDNQTDVPEPFTKSTSGCLDLNHIFRSLPDFSRTKFGIQGEALLSNEAAPSFS